MGIDISDVHTPRLGSTADDNMPLQRCEHEGKPAWRWGESGKAYTYEPGNEESERRARKQAISQGLAIGGGTLKKDAVPSLDEMIADELKGSGDYARASDEATDPDIKSMFLSMSQDELRHSEMLKTIAAQQMTKAWTVDIAKIADNVIYGIVLKANTEDLQGDFMSPDDIREAMHDYMAQYRSININHADDIDACPVECWQAKESGTLGNSRYNPGDWIMGTRIYDESILQAVREGKFRSYSIEGVGQRVPLS